MQIAFLKQFTDRKTAALGGKDSSQSHMTVTWQNPGTTTPQRTCGDITLFLFVSVHQGELLIVLSVTLAHG